MIESIINSDKAELTQSTEKSAPVVLSTRVRLARNLVNAPFPERASMSQRSDVMAICANQIADLSQMKNGAFFDVAELSDLERQVLLERHLISRELCDSQSGSGVFINKDQTCSVMINEEDHLRIQFLKTGFSLRSVWKQINQFDSNLENELDLAFSSEFGYLTACPTNLGTGLRASVMLHLPGLVISNNMDKVIRAVNQLGIAVRGLFGEGSDATGHVFQISNQQTLGESEEDILTRLGSVFNTIIDHEINARFKYLEENCDCLLDQIGRAFGVLQNAHVLNSNEAMNLLSLMRLAVDLQMLPEVNRSDIDRLFIECQPGHIQYVAGEGIEPDARDHYRAETLREKFSHLPALDFDKINKLG